MRDEEERKGLWYFVLFLLVFGNALAVWFFAQLLATRDIQYGSYTMLTGVGMVLGSWLARRLGTAGSKRPSRRIRAEGEA